MKKVLSLLLVMVLCLSLCACKSSEVKNVEAQICTLNANSTYAEIHSVYSLYSSLPLKEQDKVENVSVLSDYCDPRGGELRLTAEIRAEIDKKFEKDSSGSTDALSDAQESLSIRRITEKWSSYKNVKISSYSLDDVYTYGAYGTVDVVDKYGNTLKKKFELCYRAEYSAEEPAGFTITHFISLQ